MSREHLFKAKRVNWRELPKEEWWVEGFYAQLPKPSLGATIAAGGDLCAEDVADYIIVNKAKQYSNFSNANPLEVVECEQYEVDLDTVCEYTGYTDFRKKEAFEHDIVFYEDGECFGHIMFEEGRFLIEWQESRPDLKNDIHFWFTERRLYIVGNIFDNPELLKGDGTE